MFESNFRRLANSGMRPIGQVQREDAFSQFVNYFRQNRDDMERIIGTEVDVSVEKNSYIISGKIDILLGRDGKLEFLDFKSQSRPKE